MLSCYRASEASDPDSFIAEAASVFARYPEEVARRVSYAMPSESKWLPSIAEIREACDKADAPRLAAERRQAERARTAAIVGDGTPEQDAERRKQVIAEIRARLAGLGEDPNRAAAHLDPRALSGEARIEATNRLAESLRQTVADYAARPVTLSEAARRRFVPSEAAE